MNTTRRHPRTLTEAFGPYASGPIEEPGARNRRADRIALRASVLALAALLVLVLIGVVK